MNRVNRSNCFHKIQAAIYKGILFDKTKVYLKDVLFLEMTCEKDMKWLFFYVNAILSMRENLFISVLKGTGLGGDTNSYLDWVGISS